MTNIPSSNPRRLIEVDLPIKRISEHARREKSIRHGHISTLHIWWARRPLAACRAVICAALWPDPAYEHCPDKFIKISKKLMLEWSTLERQALLSAESRPIFESARKDPASFDDLMVLRKALLNFIADFSNWDNSTLKNYLETSRELTQSAHEALGGAIGTRPLVVDPFAGGGSIPLEAIRVGGDAFATDLNPVAVILNKVVLDYAPRYGVRLADEVRKWADWIKIEAEKELSEYYPKNSSGAISIAYLWARTVLSEAPGKASLPVEIPLIRSMWLARKSNRKRALRWVRDKKGQIKTQRIKISYADGTSREVLRPLLEVFEPTKESQVEKGTSVGGAATCPVTGFTVAVERVRHQLEPRNGGAKDSRLICVVELNTGVSGRYYRLPTTDEEAAIEKASDWLDDYEAHRKEGEPEIPTGHINHLRGFFNIVLYGMKTWGTLFNPRQLMVLLTLSRLIRQAVQQISEKDFSVAVEVCLSLVIGRMADGNSSLTRWQNIGEKISNTFGRQALPMVWDYAEANPFCDATRSLDSMFEWIINVIRHEATNPFPGHAEQASATRHPLPNDSAEAVITDPPYYAAVPYADLSDFFYSWLSQTLRFRLPELFTKLLTPKEEECVQLSHRASMYRNKDKAWFEKTMAKACEEARRFTKPDGIGVFVFASKETDAWESMLAALVNTGWVVTASWPVDTEMSSRLRAQESAALASSVHIICRPREKSNISARGNDIGDWRDVLQELPNRIHEWMPRLAEEGIVGADAIFSCLGPALEIFSRYRRVEKANGEEVLLKEYLEYVWAAVAKEALAMVFEGADASGFEPDARLTAMWFWTLKSAINDREPDDGDELEIENNEEKVKSIKPKGGFILEFDAARKIAQGLGANLENLQSLVEVSGNHARLLPVGERAGILFGRENGKIATSKKNREAQLTLFEVTERNSDSSIAIEAKVNQVGETVLDRIHQSMILFATGRGDALKGFLVEDGVGRDHRFWRLAQALSALYPGHTDEKRWVDGVLARKKSFGF